jgi:hypothetical protein
MPNATLIREKLRFSSVKPIDLFNWFYALFGFIITISLYSACFRHLSSPDFDILLGMSIACAPAWGLAYGGWVARQTWAWCLLTLVSISSLIALGFHLYGRPEMFVAFGFAQGTCMFWLALTGIKLGNFRDQ